MATGEHKTVVLNDGLPPGLHRAARANCMDPEEFLTHALEAEGSVTGAARRLNIARSTLYEWLDAVGLRVTGKRFRDRGAA